MTKRLLTAGIIPALAAPLPLHAQRGSMGTVVGRTATQLPNNLHHYGSMAGAFLQVDMSDHLGFRIEANWVRFQLVLRSGAGSGRREVQPRGDPVLEAGPQENRLPVGV